MRLMGHVCSANVSCVRQMEPACCVRVASIYKMTVVWNAALSLPDALLVQIQPSARLA